VFLWLLYREAVLTKDNLVKRNGYGNVMCCFCDAFETVQHLFFDYALAKFIWRVIKVTFGISITLNMKHVLGDWIQRIEEKEKRLLFVGMSGMFWSIWLSQNDIIFNKTPISSFMQVMFRATY
jgi:hypothetical protein